jgi:3-deoxy-7-phosphoheptulonate synthase
MKACGIDLFDDSALQSVDFYTSHEALVLPYEQALTRRDSLTGDWYDCSAHMLWIGERTREADGAHVEFLSGVHNPIGVKLGPTTTADEALALCERLNPERQPGRLTFITRLGASDVTTLLPPIVRAVTAAGHPVVWACDPMHGNTFLSDGGRKTRRFDDVLREIQGFFAVHRAEGTQPGGVHVELTGDNVTECLGGAESILPEQLELRYTSTCDPRLNRRAACKSARRGMAQPWLAPLLPPHSADRPTRGGVRSRWRDSPLSARAASRQSAPRPISCSALPSPCTPGWHRSGTPFPPGTATRPRSCGSSSGAPTR